MGKINVLDFNVANLIAAGEVVERPASAVKELIENSIDAGARNITVEIKNGGISLMRVTDDGCGMSRDDAVLCIKRHATSKIKEASDLSYIMTLGFRGEALAALSSVTKIRIITKRSEDPVGTLLESEYGATSSVSDTGCPCGTTIIAEELFSNVPARRKFLKKDAAETMAVTSTVEKAALANPSVAVKLICDGRVRFSTCGDGSLRSAVYATMGREVATKLCEASGETNGVEVKGFIGTPELARKNRNSENFFLNGRYIKSTTVSSAVEAAFQTYIPADKFPVCILHISIHPSLVDVNVHPSKLEVKFSNDRTVFDSVFSTVRGALVHSIERPQFSPREERVLGCRSADMLISAFVPDPDRTEKTKERPSSLFDIPYREPEPQKTETAPGVYVFDDSDAPVPEADKVFCAEELSKPNVKQQSAPVTVIGPAHKSEAAIPSENAVEAKKADEETYNTASSSVLPETVMLPEAKKEESAGSKKPDEYRIIGVAANAYVFVETDDRVLVIDKHAAHERILFERMKANMRKSRGCSRVLFVPESVPLDAGEISAASEFVSEIRDAGFEFSIDEDRHSALITEIPTEIDYGSARGMFEEMLSRISEYGESAGQTRDSVFERALFQASCKAAVKAGYSDDPENIAWIVREVMENTAIRYCPHGRPVAFEMTKHDIEHRFKRI